jgi:hypothetical protein
MHHHMQHRKLTCYLDVIFVWSIGGLDSAKTVNLTCESSVSLHPLTTLRIQCTLERYVIDNKACETQL